MMDRPTFSTSNNTRKNKENDRRSSILKIGKSDDDNVPIQTIASGRRVSFADTHQVQEFLLSDSGHSENTSDLIEKCTTGEYPLKLALPILSDVRISTKEFIDDKVAMTLKPSSVGIGLNCAVEDNNSIEMSLTQTIENTIHCPKDTGGGVIVKCTDDSIEASPSIDMTLTDVINDPLHYLQSDFKEVDGEHDGNCYGSLRSNVNRDSKYVEYTQYTKDMSLTGPINNTIYTRKDDQNQALKSQELIYYEKENININQLPDCSLILESNKKLDQSNAIDYVQDTSLTRYIDQPDYHENDTNTNILDQTKYTKDMSMTRQIDKTIFIPGKRNDNICSDDIVLDRQLKIETARNDLDVSKVSDNFKKDDNVLTPKRQYAELSKPFSLKKKKSGSRILNVSNKKVEDSFSQRDTNNVEIVPDFGTEYKLTDDNLVIVVRTPSKTKKSENEDSVLNYERKLESQVEVKTVPVRKIGSGLFSKRAQDLYVIKPGSSVKPVNKITSTQVNKKMTCIEPLVLGNTTVEVETVIKDDIKSKPSQMTFKLPQFLVKSGAVVKSKLNQRIQQKLEDKTSPDSFGQEKPNVEDDLLLVKIPETSFVDIGCCKLDQDVEVGTIRNVVTDHVSPTKVESIENNYENADNGGLILNINDIKASGSQYEDNGSSSKSKGTTVTKSKTGENTATKSKNGDSAVRKCKIPDRIVTRSKKGDSLVTKTKIVDSSITKPKNVDSSVTKPKNIYPSVTIPKNTDSSVTKPKNIDSSVTKPKNIDFSVTKPKNIDSSVTKPKNIDSSVTKPKNIDSSVTKPKNIDSSVNKPKNIDSSVTKPKNIDSLVTKPKNIDSSVTKPKNIDSLVTKPKNIDSSVTKPKNIDSSVTKPKNIDSSVTKPKNIDSSVTKPKNIDSSVTKPKNIDSSVTKPKNIDSSVTKPNNIDSSVTKPNNIDSSVTKPKNIDSSVTKPKNIDSSVTKPSGTTVSKKDCYFTENSMADKYQPEGLSLTTNITTVVDGHMEYLENLSQIGTGGFRPPTSSTEILKKKDLKTCIEEVLNTRQVAGHVVVKEYLPEDYVVFEFFEWQYPVCLSFSFVNIEWYNSSISSVKLLDPSGKLEKSEELAFIAVKYQLMKFKFEEKQFTINELPKCLNYINDAVLIGQQLLKDYETLDFYHETILILKEDHAQIIEEMYSLSYRIIFDTIYTIDYVNYSTKPLKLSFVVKMGSFSSDIESILNSEVAKEQPGPNYIYRVSQSIKQYLRNNPIYNKPPPNKKLLSWIY